MEKLSETDREFGEGMALVKLQKFVESKVQTNPNAGKIDASRQGVNPKVGEFGGYTSHQEWATKDPAGYQRERNPLDAQDGIKIAYE